MSARKIVPPKSLRAVEDPAVAKLGQRLNEIRRVLSMEEVEAWYSRACPNGEVTLPTFKNIVNGKMIARNNVTLAMACLPIGNAILKDREEKINELLNNQ